MYVFFACWLQELKRYLGLPTRSIAYIIQYYDFKIFGIDKNCVQYSNHNFSISIVYCVMYINR